MGAGNYRHLVQVQRINPNATQTAAREIDKTKDENWETFATRYMEITPGSGGETTAKQVEAFLLHTVKARFDSVTQTITPKHRLLYRTRKLDIASVRTVRERNREVVMECSEAV